MTPVAIFGGTFDPVHFGHLRVAWEAAQLLDARVAMVPSSVPPHRAQPIATAQQRIAMLRAALLGQDRLFADDRELRREGPSYTVDTMHEIRAELGPQQSLALLIGADAFAELSGWNRWRELFEVAHLVVLTRPGHGGVFEAELATEWFTRRVADVSLLRAQPHGAILPLEVTPLEISASAIREHLAQGRCPRYLLPDAVVQYIEDEGLYREP